MTKINIFLEDILPSLVLNEIGDSQYNYNKKIKNIKVDNIKDIFYISSIIKNKNTYYSLSYNDICRENLLIDNLLDEIYYIKNVSFRN